MSSVIMNCGGAAAGLVTGMAFSAQEITEKRLVSIGTQILIALIARDAEGRTRREILPPGLPGLIMISDPVAGFFYLLHPDMTALRSPLPVGGLPLPLISAGLTPPGAGISLQPPPSPQELGERMIEGFLAKGTRSITTIPAGQVIMESWCAQALGAVIESSHSDPRIGQIATRLKGIQQAHPPGHLFQVPQNYRVVDSARSAAPRR
ncbi:MAG: hypothetical protein ABSF98_01585 [Bryobacteraceae bacterium]|jgi:hypothetical protein